MSVYQLASVQEKKEESSNNFTDYEEPGEKVSVPFAEGASCNNTSNDSHGDDESIYSAISAINAP